MPDLVTLGKPMGNGHPMGAVIATRAVAEAFGKGPEYFNTFGGNPVSCRAALAVLDLLQGGMLEKAAELGKKITNWFLQLQQEYELIGDIRALGPMVGVELVKDRQTKEPAGEQAEELVRRCYEKGLIILRCGPYHNVIRTLMPLVITDDQLEQGFTILEESLAEVSS